VSPNTVSRRAFALFSEFQRIHDALFKSLRLVSRAGRRQLTGAAIVMLVVAVTTNYPAVVLGGLVDRFLKEKPNLVVAFPYLAMILGLVCIREISQVGRRYLAEQAATELERQLRVQATSAILHGDQESFADTQSGALYGRMSRGVEGATRLVKLTFLDLLPSVVIAAVATWLVWMKDWRVGLAVTAILPAMLTIVAIQLRSQRGVRVSLLRRKETVDGAIVELLRDLDSVKALDATGFETRRVGQVAEELERIELQHHIKMAWFDALKFGTEGLAHIGITTFAIILATKQSLSVGGILTISLLFIGVMAPIRELHRIFDEGHESSLQAEDLHAMLATPADPSFQSVRIPNETAAVRGGAIACCNDLRIRYRSREYPAVSGVDLTVRDGEFVGLCGPAGCGKSTLVKSLLRLVHQEAGAVHLLGQPIESFDRRMLAGAVAYVPQSSFLITGTVRENIAYGLENIGLDDIVDAAKKARIHEEILEFPKGYETTVGEAGVRLSGGQRQRVALARVFLRRPRLVVLDEATSNLDNLNESEIQVELESAGFTMLAIAHRLSTLRNANEIIVMNRGRVVERGTYQDLLANRGLFYSLDAAGRLQ